MRSRTREIWHPAARPYSMDRDDEAHRNLDEYRMEPIQRPEKEHFEDDAYTDDSGSDVEEGEETPRTEPEKTRRAGTGDRG